MKKLGAALGGIALFVVAGLGVYTISAEGDNPTPPPLSAEGDNPTTQPIPADWPTGIPTPPPDAFCSGSIHRFPADPNAPGKLGTPIIEDVPCDQLPTPPSDGSFP